MVKPWLIHAMLPGWKPSESAALSPATVATLTPRSARAAARCTRPGWAGAVTTRPPGQNAFQIPWIGENLGKFHSTDLYHDILKLINELLDDQWCMFGFFSTLSILFNFIQFYSILFNFHIFSPYNASFHHAARGEAFFGVGVVGA